MSINVVEKIDDRVRVKHALISVSDKSELELLVKGLVRICPGIRILSTGGTYARIREILGEKGTAEVLQQVADYTGQPETQGGLVKTLDFKIYLGLLTETYNTSHQADLERTSSISIDMVIVNLYPFRETVAKSGVTVEAARGNIDIGGPCMIRAAAKNFIRVASMVDPGDYADILRELESNGGATTLALRFRLACKAFDHTAAYDRAIADFFAGRTGAEAAAGYAFSG